MAVENIDAERHATDAEELDRRYRERGTMNKQDINIFVRETAPGVYALCLCLLDGNGQLVMTSRGESPEGRPDFAILQAGYRTPQQAVAALIEALTTAPPDISTLEEAAGQVGQLLDAVNNLNDGMTAVGDRLRSIEDRLDAIESARPGAPLRALRPGTSPASPAPPSSVPSVDPTAPPPIRRPKAMVPHQPSGGAFKPGEPGAEEG